MTEYTTNIDICNKALQEIGCARITSLSGSRNADECGFLYDKARQALLREHVWGFSIAYQTLELSGTVVYQNQLNRNKFSLPTDFVRLADQNPRQPNQLSQAVTGGIKSTDYSIEGGYLVTGQPSVILRYASNVMDVTLMDPLFCDALAAKMCVDGLAEMLTQNVQKRQLAEQRYTSRIALAKIIQIIEAAGDEPIEEMLRSARVLEQPPRPQQQQQQPQGR